MKKNILVGSIAVGLMASAGCAYAAVQGLTQVTSESLTAQSTMYVEKDASDNNICYVVITKTTNGVESSSISCLPIQTIPAAEVYKGAF